MIWNQTRWNQSHWAPVANNNQTHKPMSQQNLASLRLDEAWMTELKTRIQAVITHLLTKAVPLTVEDRRKYKTIGPENTSMVNNGIALIRENAGWFPGTFDRTEVLADVDDRELLLEAKGPMMQARELFEDTLHAVSSDILKGVGNARPYIEQGAEMSGMNNTQVKEFLDYFKRFGPQGGGDTPPPPPPAPPTPPTTPPAPPTPPNP